MAHDATFRDLQVSSAEIGIRTIAVSDLRAALREGYSDFTDKPTFGVFLIIVYIIFALVLTLAFLGRNLQYLLFPMIAGFTLIGPVVSVALFEISRRREAGMEPTWRNAFDFVHTGAFAPVLALSLAMMLLYVVWLLMAEFIYFSLFGNDSPSSLVELLILAVTTRQGGALIFYGSGLGLIFAFTALATSVFAFPLLLDKPTTASTAVNVSIRALVANFGVMLVWAALVVALLAAGALVFLIGLAAVLPILGHATWHLYRKVVEA